ARGARASARPPRPTRGSPRGTPSPSPRGSRRPGRGATRRARAWTCFPSTSAPAPSPRAPPPARHADERAVAPALRGPRRDVSRRARRELLHPLDRDLDRLEALAGRRAVAVGVFERRVPHGCLLRLHGGVRGPEKPPAIGPTPGEGRELASRRPPATRVIPPAEFFLSLLGCVPHERDETQALTLEGLA